MRTTEILPEVSVIDAILLFRRLGVDVTGMTPDAVKAARRDLIHQHHPDRGGDLDTAKLINAAYDIHHDDPAFGYRFIADELARQGIATGENRVARLCAQQRIWSQAANRLKQRIAGGIKVNCRRGLPSPSNCAGTPVRTACNRRSSTRSSRCLGP